nr:hypothetical protein [Tanacetum cinerariifolium]
MGNEGNGNGGNRNGNGNGNGGGNGYNFGGLMPARECTYQDFLKYQSVNFNGTEGVIGLTRWFEKIEMVFNISNYPQKYQVNNETAKDLWDALERQMRGSDYGEQDRKAAILYEYETFKAIEGEQLLDTYLRYLQVINDLKKCGYKKDACELNYKFLNNMQPEWKQYGDVNDALGYKKKAVVVTSNPLAVVAKKTKVSKRKEKVVVSSDSKGSEFVKSDDKKVKKKDDEKKRDMTKVKCYNCKKEGHFAKDCKKAKEINANMVFMAQIEKVLSDSDKSSSSAEETIAEDDQEIFHDAIDSASENFIENHIDSRKDYDKSEVDHNDSEEKEHLVDKLIRKFNHKIAKCQKRFENPSYFEKAKDLRPSLYDEKVIGLGYTQMFLIHSDEALEIEKFKRARENKIEFAYDYGNLNASYVNEKINFSNDYFQEIINPYFEKIDSPFQQTSSLKPYVPTVILEMIIIDLKDEVVSLFEKEKANLKTIKSLKSKGFESSENEISKSENQSEKECDQVENSKVIAVVC